jgi:hypothetical protein
MNRSNLAVRTFAAKDKNRYTLQAILATEHETVATDGHVLARVSLPALDAANFPALDGFKPNGFTRGLIPVDAAKTIEAAIPEKNTIPVLTTAAITADHSDNTLKVAVTDLDTPQVFTVRQPDGQFPNWDMVFEKPDRKPVMDICFDANLLAAVSQFAAKFSDKNNAPIRLRFYSASNAMRFDVVNGDGQELNGLIMPMRAAIKPTFKAELEPEPEPTAQAAKPETESEPETEPAAQAGGNTLDRDTAHHLQQWLEGEFTAEVIAVHRMIERMTAVYLSDAEFYGNQSWWKVFEAAGIPRTAQSTQPGQPASDSDQSLQQLAGAGRLAISEGYGYWDTTAYPYGGDFRRATDSTKVSEILRDLENTRREVEVRLHDGHKAVVEKRALVIA